MVDIFADFLEAGARAFEAFLYRKVHPPLDVFGSRWDGCVGQYICE